MHSNNPHLNRWRLNPCLKRTRRPNRHFGFTALLENIYLSDGTNTCALVPYRIKGRSWNIGRGTMSRTRTRYTLFNPVSSLLGPGTFHQNSGGKLRIATHHLRICPNEKCAGERLFRVAYDRTETIFKHVSQHPECKALFKEFELSFGGGTKTREWGHGWKACVTWSINCIQVFDMAFLTPC